MGRASAVVGILVAATVGCGERGQLSLAPKHRGDEARPALGTKRLDELQRWEEKTRAATDFSALPPFDENSGSNPYRVAAIPGGRFVALLRGSSEVALLGPDGAELGRVPAPSSPVDLAFAKGQLLVVGEGSAEVARYRVGDTLEPAGRVAVPGAVALRAVAAGDDGTVYVADEATGAVTEMPATGEPREIDRCHTPLQIERVAGDLLVNCLLEHEVRVYTIGRGGEAERVAAIHHDGPIWRFAAAKSSGGLVIAATGVEDHPLDRSVKGSFGYLDSFVFAYALRGAKLERLAAVNVGELGLVIPKWLELELDPAGGAAIRAASYGGDRMVRLSWSGRIAGDPEVEGRDVPPGITDLARAGDTWIAADPLFDELLVGGADGAPRPIPVTPADPRGLESRVGEVLFFSRMMAPWAQSTGFKSRFTCEACHFEGYVDGRTHYTGRDDVHATSRSLHGLFNNRPHFSRALDRTTAGMVNNEFRVANKLSGHDSWFSLSPTEMPWLTHLRAELPATMTPQYLRRSFMTFLRDFTNAPNPFARGRDHFSDLERRGAELFAERCESCHAARLITDDPETRVAPKDWERHIFSPTSGIVWASEGYQRTGVTPYVNELGCRTPSLRRLYKKWPYFTNGSAKTLTELVEAVRFSGDTVAHHGLEKGQSFDRGDVEALVSFLRIL